MTKPNLRKSGKREVPPRNVPTPPTGWVVGSYQRYEQAQQAVNHLARKGFPIEQMTIVGVDLMQVERVVGRLTWPRVLRSGALSGLWFGLFFGILIGFFTPSIWPMVLNGLLGGLLVGVVFAAVTYGLNAGRRNFASTSQLVASRYDVLCEPEDAEQVRDELYRFGMRSPHAEARDRTGNWAR